MESNCLVEEFSTRKCCLCGLCLDNTRVRISTYAISNKTNPDLLLVDLCKSCHNDTPEMFETTMWVFLGN